MNKRTCFGSIQLFSLRFDSTPSEGGVSAFAIHSLSIHIVFFLNFNETFILRAFIKLIVFRQLFQPLVP